MIVEFLIELAANLVGWIADLFPEWELPTNLSFVEFMATATQFIHGMGVWVPWTLIVICVGITTTAWVVTVVIKVIRAILAHIPAFGGAGD